MRVLVVGSGAREHAIAWKLRQSPRVGELLVAPGNAGTGELGANLPLAATDLEGLAREARSRRVDLTVVGPEGPLAAGIVDRFQRDGLAVVGPTRAAARIESSKAFAKGLMARHGIPTGDAVAFSSYADALRHVEGAPLPMVVKADGLAAGKGVAVCRTRDEARQALRRCLVERAFGAAGDTVLVEEFLEGPEVSVFAFTDGHSLSPLVAACDYKRVGDGDAGPNTGGMGGYSPPAFWTPALAERVMAEVMAPAVRAMAAEGSPFQGVLYGGLVLTGRGPRVIEFNCRLGDPEAQVILPRLRSDLLEVLLAIAGGSIERCRVQWSQGWCVGVALASGGYPGEYATGHVIEGLDTLGPGVTAFHGGTRRDPEGRVVTDGGRVVTLVGLGETLEEARSRAYQGAEQVRFSGAHYRRDIALLAAPREAPAREAGEGRATQGGGHGVEFLVRSPQGKPDTVEVRYDCACGCKPRARYQRGTDEAAHEHCCCGRVHFVGAGAMARLEAYLEERRGQGLDDDLGYHLHSTQVRAPWGEAVAVAYAVPDRPREH